MANLIVDPRPFLGSTFCAKLNVSQACGISLDPDGNIVSLGPWQRRTFEPRPDLAGPGVCIRTCSFFFFLFETQNGSRDIADRSNKVLLAFVLTSVFVNIGVLIAFLRVLSKWRKVGMHRSLASERRGRKKMFYKAFRTFLLATSDTQMLLMFAYGLNFLVLQQCTISAYHYTIVTEIGLIAGANIVLTLAFVTEYWKAPITGALRFCATLALFVFLGYVLIHQRTRSESPEYIPSFDRKDSAILLPASCFLNSGPVDIYSSLNTSVREKVGYPMNPDQFWEFPLWIMLCILLVADFWRTFMQLIYDRRMKANTYPLREGVLVFLYKGVAIALSGVTTGVAWGRIFFLKKWVAQSGWIKPGRISNPEEDWRGNGQILPMIQLAVIGIFISNEYELGFYSPVLKKSSSQPDIQPGEMNAQD